MKYKKREERRKERERRRQQKEKMKTTPTTELGPLGNLLKSIIVANTFV